MGIHPPGTEAHALAYIFEADDELETQEYPTIVAQIL